MYFTCGSDYHLFFGYEHLVHLGLRDVAVRSVSAEIHEHIEVYVQFLSDEPSPYSPLHDANGDFFGCKKRRNVVIP